MYRMARHVGGFESKTERGISRSALLARSCIKIFVSQAMTSHLWPLSLLASPAECKPPDRVSYQQVQGVLSTVLTFRTHQ